MRLARHLFLPATLIVVLASGLMPRVAAAQGPCCIRPDNGTGTADHPPSCPSGYVGHLEMVDGLPPGSTIQIPATLGTPGGFTSLIQVPGGSLGGMQENWQSNMTWQMSGTGAFAGYNRLLIMPISAGETHSAPRTLFSPFQSFNTVLHVLQGQLPPGDPDFDLLRITAGNGFGMPSPGHTTFTTASGSWAVDSFFDITYRIDFVGHAPGPFAGMSGSTTRVFRFEMCHDEPTVMRTGTWGRVKALYR
jgi:hypothetical protein